LRTATAQWDAAHHHALENRLAADGASRCAISPVGQAGLSGRTGGDRRSFSPRCALGGATLEALDATAGVDELLLARVERVAVGADLDVHVALGRARGELVAARAANVRLDVSGWMSVFMMPSL
jgi:hypothetical protein